MLCMCVCMHSRFVENHPIWILEGGPLISEVVLSQPLPIPSDNCYHACNLGDEENYGIVQEDDLLTSFNVEIREGLDSLVGDPNNVEDVVMKRK
jgi:hypothetical protein